MPVLGEAAAFVEASATHVAAKRRSVRARVIWTIELFERLEEAERASYVGSNRKGARELGA